MFLAQALFRSNDLGVQISQIGATEIAQLNALEVIPDALVRIKIRGIDRIKAESIKREHEMIDGERRRRPIEFSYWIDGSIAKSGLSQRWLTHTIEREEVYVDERGKHRCRVLVRAKAYSGWRVILQLHKYGDKAELVDPSELREQMRQEVGRMYRFYER